MGHPINSTWTRIHEKDINKLNAILDNEYCNELEIGRQLQIMRTFEQLFAKALEDFNFDVVIKFMEDNYWEWSMYKNGKSYSKVPNKEEMIKMIRREFFNHGLYNIIKLRKNHYSATSGGVVVDMGMTGEWPSEDNCYLNIYFDIASF